MKKKEYPSLNDEQRQMVADNYKLAYLCASNLRSVIAANGIDIDDAVGIAWIGMCESISGFDGKSSSLSTFLYMACKNAILHEVRKAGMQKRTAMKAISFDAPVVMDNGEEFSGDGVSPKHTELDEMYAGKFRNADPAAVYEVKEEITIRMNAISERDQEIVLLSNSGFKQHEIGRMFGISQGAVTQVVRKSYVRMRGVAC